MKNRSALTRILDQVSEETIEEIHDQEIPTEQPDQLNMRNYLLSVQQEAMRQAAHAADEAARSGAFERYREEKRPNTIRRQRADIRCFQRYLDAAGVPMTATCQVLGFDLFDTPALWQHVTFGLVLGFRRWQLWTVGYAIESVNAHLQTVKFYSALAAEAGFLPKEQLISILRVPLVSQAAAEQIDERRRITRIGIKKAEPTYLAPEHLKQLFAERPQTAQAWRDLTALRFLYDMAMRPSEAVTRAIGDLDLQAGTIAVYRKKNRVRQKLPLSRGTLIALHNYVPLLEEKYKAQWGGLFPHLPLLLPTDRDQDLVDAFLPPPHPKWPLSGMSTQALYERVKELGERIGVSDLCPYDARHQYARGVVQAGTDVVTATKFGGWRSESKMLARYYGDEEIVAAVSLPWD